MRIIRILNNNVVLVEDIEGKEVVALGKEIVFQKSVMILLLKRISRIISIQERIYRLDERRKH